MSEQHGNGPAVLSAAEAVGRIESGATVVVVGSGGGINEPDALLRALEARFLTDGAPRDLVLVHPNGMGDGAGGGTERFAHDGMLQTVYGSHWSWAPRLSEMALRGEFALALWPQGVLSQLLRASAGGRPGLLTRIGGGTYLDPRSDSPQMPGRQLLPDLLDVDGETWLHYRLPRPDVTLLRATSADTTGNLTMEDEGVVLDVLAAAQAARTSGGTVIAQVKRRVERADPRLVRVPGYLVDALVVHPEQRQSAMTEDNPSFSGAEVVALPDDQEDKVERELIAARAALELRPGMVVNVGFGIADGVPRAAVQRGTARGVTFTVEQGAAGGMPARGADFGLMWNPTSILDAPSVFDLYDGGGLDLALVSFGEVDAQGNVNVSYLGDRLIGPGGFINITQGARTVVFCGTITTRGLDVKIDSGGVAIRNEGSVRKFVRRCAHVTWSAHEARRRGQHVVYVTERGVFHLTESGPQLVELAPGMDVEHDVLPAMEFEPSIAPDLAYGAPEAWLPTREPLQTSRSAG